jgi:hypothetical protein
MMYFEQDVLEPTHSIVSVYRDYWWWCVEGDPKRALFWRSSDRDRVGHAQCNHSKECAEAVGKRLGHDTRATLVQIPLAFAPWEC